MTATIVQKIDSSLVGWDWPLPKPESRYEERIPVEYGQEMTEELLDRMPLVQRIDHDPDRRRALVMWVEAEKTEFQRYVNAMHGWMEAQLRAGLPNPAEYVAAVEDHAKQLNKLRERCIRSNSHLASFDADGWMF